MMRGFEANYMRATQASRSRHLSLDNKKHANLKAGARQASLKEWNFSGNVSQYATIGLISRKKQSMIAHNTRRMMLNKRQANLLRGSTSDKENSASTLTTEESVSDLSQRLAARRNVKAKAKAARKEIKLI